MSIADTGLFATSPDAARSIAGDAFRILLFVSSHDAENGFPSCLCLPLSDS